MMDGVTPRPLPYIEGLESRRVDSIELVVIHATELPDLTTAREYGERIHYAGSGTGNSGHFYIDRDGRVEQWVPLERVAHHVRGHNQTSVGIELVNRGRWPHWYRSDHQHWSEPYSEDQIEALISLLKQLRTCLPALDFVAGHDNLDRRLVASEDQPKFEIRRKLDPGPDFPWADVLDGSGLNRAPRPADE